MTFRTLIFFGCIGIAGASSAVVDFAARKEVARIKLPASATEFETDAGRATSPSHGIGVAPDGKTLWVTSIPNNAVFVYSS